MTFNNNNAYFSEKNEILFKYTENFFLVLNY